MVEIRADRLMKGMLGVGVCMALTPGVFSLGPVLETRFFPVSREVHIASVKQTGDGLSLHVRFKKVRRCRFQALVWVDDGVRHVVEMEATAAQFPRPRPRGDQVSGPWIVRGLDGLGGTEAFAYHRCHPLWTTVTRFYDGAAGYPAKRETEISGDEE